PKGVGRRERRVHAVPGAALHHFLLCPQERPRKPLLPDVLGAGLSGSAAHAGRAPRTGRRSRSVRVRSPSLVRGGGLGGMTMVKQQPVRQEAAGEPLGLQAFPVNPWAWIIRLHGPIDAANVSILDTTISRI